MQALFKVKQLESSHPIACRIQCLKCLKAPTWCSTKPWVLRWKLAIKCCVLVVMCWLTWCWRHLNLRIVDDIHSCLWTSCKASSAWSNWRHCSLSARPNMHADARRPSGIDDGRYDSSFSRCGTVVGDDVSRDAATCRHSCCTLGMYKACISLQRPIQCRKVLCFSNKSALWRVVVFWADISTQSLHLPNPQVKIRRLLMKI